MHCARCVAATVEEDLERGRKSRKYRLAPGVEKVGGRGEKCEIGKLLLKKKAGGGGEQKRIFKTYSDYPDALLGGQENVLAYTLKKRRLFSRISRDDAPFPITSLRKIGRKSSLLGRKKWETGNFSFPGSILEPGGSRDRAGINYFPRSIFLQSSLFLIFQASRKSYIECVQRV